VKQLPAALTKVLDEHVHKIICDSSLSDEQIKEIHDCLTASYAYGVACGLGMSSAATGRSMFEILPVGDKGNPMINSILSAAASVEPETVEYFKEELGL
jgi:hypothetical protein